MKVLIAGSAISNLILHSQCHAVGTFMLHVTANPGDVDGGSPGNGNAFE